MTARRLRGVARRGLRGVTAESLLHTRGPRPVRVDDDVSGDRAHVLARQMIAGIAVVHQPVAAVDVAHEDHDVMVARGGHARRGRSAREFADPGGGEIELAPHLAEYVARGLAAAELVRTAGGTSADDDLVAVGVSRADVGARGAGVVVSRPRREPVRTAAHVADDRLLDGV